MGVALFYCPFFTENWVFFLFFHFNSKVISPWIDNRLCVFFDRTKELKNIKIRKNN